MDQQHPTTGNGAYGSVPSGVRRLYVITPPQPGPPAQMPEVVQAAQVELLRRSEEQMQTLGRHRRRALIVSLVTLLGTTLSGTAIMLGQLWSVPLLAINSAAFGVNLMSWVLTRDSERRLLVSIRDLRESLRAGERASETESR